MWHYIKGYKNYMISEDGKVLSLPRRKFLPQNGGWIMTKMRIMKPSLGTWGYYTIVLAEDGKSAAKLIHRLLAETLIPNPDNKPEVNHKDGNKLNNSLSNLEWVTYSENIKHALNTGLRIPAKGERNGNSKLNIDKVKDIFRLVGMGFTHDAVAKQMNIHQSTVSRIISKQMWKVA